MPPRDDSSIEHAREEHHMGALAILLETAKRWGIFAGIMCGLIGWVLWFTWTLFDRDTEREQYLRGKLTTIVEKDIEARAEVVDALKDFTEKTDDLGEAIEDLTEAQKENPKTP